MQLIRYMLFSRGKTAGNGTCIYRHYTYGVYLIVEGLQKSGAQPFQVRQSGEDTNQSFSVKLCGCDVQFLETGLLPNSFLDMTILQSWKISLPFTWGKERLASLPACSIKRHFSFLHLWSTVLRQEPLTWQKFTQRHSKLAQLEEICSKCSSDTNKTSNDSFTLQEIFHAFSHTTYNSQVGRIWPNFFECFFGLPMYVRNTPLWPGSPHLSTLSSIRQRYRGVAKHQSTSKNKYSFRANYFFREICNVGKPAFLLCYALSTSDPYCVVNIGGLKLSLTPQRLMTLKFGRWALSFVMLTVS